MISVSNYLLLKEQILYYVGKLFFVSATKIGENITDILNCYFSTKIHILAYQTIYQHVGN